MGSQKAFHPLGEIAVARAAKAKDHLQVLSTVATTSIEDAISARGATVWFQLYHQPDWARTRQMVERAERAGSAAVVFTVDLNSGSNRETMIRGARLDTRTCTNCHLGGAPIPGIKGGSVGDNRRKPNLNGYPALTPIPEVGTPSWEFIDRLKAATKMKVWIKGIVTREDAEIAMQHGVDGLFVSNHGGRAENSLRATITSLPEVVEGVAGRAPIICDGGFRRGTDVFKAMALGASSIGIGRPVHLGARRLRSGRCGDGAPVAAERIRARDEADGNDVHCRHHAKFRRGAHVARTHRAPSAVESDSASAPARDRDRAGRTIPDEPAIHLQAPQGVGEGRARGAGQGRPVAPPGDRGGAAGSADAYLEKFRKLWEDRLDRLELYLEKLKSKPSTEE